MRQIRIIQPSHDSGHCHGLSSAADDADISSESLMLLLQLRVCGIPVCLVWYFTGDQQKFPESYGNLAERGGFEPPVQVLARTTV